MMSHEDSTATVILLFGTVFLLIFIWASLSRIELHLKTLIRIGRKE
jgi:hypothetical protein